MVSPRTADSHEEYCPVPDHVLGQLYSADPHGLDELVASVPESARAMLAMYCYRRTHLQSIGLAIATRCSEFELRNWGGYAGSVLYLKSREAPAQASPSHYQSRRMVTLSRGILKNIVQDEDDEEVMALCGA